MWIEDIGLVGKENVMTSNNKKIYNWVGQEHFG
jgi:hypothetical protein